MATDPVCGMFVEEGTAELRLVRDNRTYFFCARSCLETFAAPELHRASLRRRLVVAAPLALSILGLTYLWHPPGWPWAAAALGAVVQVYAGRPFYEGAFDAIRSRSGNMDLLVAVGTTAAFGYSVLALVPAAGLPPAYYFDAAALILTLLLAGNYLELFTRARASGALRRLAEFAPSTAHLQGPAGPLDRPVADLTPGVRVLVRPGERFPVDGVVRSGATTADESILTGESRPMLKSAGSGVLSGSLNGEGSVEVEVTRVGADTFLAEIGRLLADAETARVPLQRLADRIAAAFAPLVLLLGVSAAVAWSVFGGAGAGIALLIFVSVVITACPCAFGIATPAAIVVGTGRAAESGLLFRGSDAIERAAVVDLVLTDKTGTLTEGVPAIVGILPNPPHSAEEVLSTALSVESGSEHPLARAVRAEAATRKISALPAEMVHALPGEGVAGRIGAQEIRVGSIGPHWGGFAAEVRGELERCQTEGRTCAAVSRDGDVLGALAFADSIRPGARAAIEDLRSAGIDTVMVTGDSEAPARAVAGAVGIRDVRSRVSPSGKVDLVREFQRAGRRVAFVGDGVNDAAALAAADLGIAIGTGTDVAKAAGQVVLLRPDPTGVPLALALGRRTVGKVRQNLLWALGYNAVLLPIAAGALVPALGFGVYAVLPITGAAAMAVSSTLVVLNSFSLRWVRVRRAAPASPAPPGTAAPG